MNKIKNKIIDIIDYIFGFEKVQKPPIQNMKTWYESKEYDKKRLNIPAFKESDIPVYMKKDAVTKTINQYWSRVGECLLSYVGDEHVIPSTELMLLGCQYKEFQNKESKKEHLPEGDQKAE